MCIRDRSKEVADGGYDEHFVLDIFQTGSGTSTNMNANEVLATLATNKLGRKVHQNDHVNMSPVSYTHLRAHETVLDLVCRLLLEKKNTN